MQTSDALNIIQALADGVDPITGETLPDNNPCQHPQVVRALFVAVTILERVEDQPRRTKILPSNAGKSWDAAEDDRLCVSFEAGMTITQLSLRHQRTYGSIKSRLVKLGKIELATPGVGQRTEAPCVGVREE